MLHPLTVAEVFDAEECTAIIRLAEERFFEDAGLVRGERYDNIRRARVTWLDTSTETAWIFDRLFETVRSANRDHFGFDLSEFAERLQIAWYDADQGGHFDWHVDIGDGPFAAKRKLTFVVQLSDGDGYAGGDLELNGNGHTYPASREHGSAALFPSFTLHRVTPLTSGARYSMTTWVHGPAFR